MTPTVTPTILDPLVHIHFGRSRNDAGRVSVLLRYILKKVLISSVSVEGGSGDKPVEGSTTTASVGITQWVKGNVKLLKRLSID